MRGVNIGQRDIIATGFEARDNIVKAPGIVPLHLYTQALCHCAHNIDFTPGQRFIIFLIKGGGRRIRVCSGNNIPTLQNVGREFGF